MTDIPDIIDDQNLAGAEDIDLTLLLEPEDYEQVNHTPFVISLGRLEGVETVTVMNRKHYDESVLGKHNE